MAEYLLRCNAKDYETMLRFQRELHFNIIRNWMGMTTDEAFYDACDENGIMVWDEFWLNAGNRPPADSSCVCRECRREDQTVSQPCLCRLLVRRKRDGAFTFPRILCSATRSKPTMVTTGPTTRIPVRLNLSGSGPWHDFDLKQYFIGIPEGRRRFSLWYAQRTRHRDLYRLR